MKLNSALLSVLVALSTTGTAKSSSNSLLNSPFESSFARLQHAPCVSLYHRNGRHGCGTEGRDVQAGKLQYFDGSLPNIDEPYIALVEEYRLTNQNVQTLLSASSGGMLQGVLVLNSTMSSDSSGRNNNNNNDEYTYKSPDSQTPQGYGTPSQNVNYGYYSYAWNPKGENLMQQDLYGLPMAYVLSSDVSQALRQEAQDEDSQENAIVAEFDYYMGPDGITSVECLAWKDKVSDQWNPKCLPLGGTSVWATAGSAPNPNQSSNNNNGNNKRPVVMLAAAMDSTSMFHDASPGSNSAASNILALLMAAKLVGANVNDATLDGFTNRIFFGFFQGEQYGFIGSRAFLRDVAYPGFKCNGNLVPASTRSAGTSNTFACLSPLRPTLDFANIGKIVGMISVDQVGHPVGEGLLYAHADKNNDNYGAFLANVLKSSGTSSATVASSSVANNGNGYPYPPTPLTSLLSLSEGAVGGAVLTGYDYAFPTKPAYHSHRDTPANAENLLSIASSATILARAAVAAAYDDGSLDYQTASQYAMNLIPELSSSDSTLLELANCLFWDGSCDLLKRYAKVEVENARIKTGLNIGLYDGSASPPNYYVGVYNGLYGQPFVQVGDNVYGAYKGDDYGKKKSDAFGMQPRLLESALYGLMNDFLGRGAAGEGTAATSCKVSSDCSDIAYCSLYGPATCSGGGECVCSRAHYHVALDESLKAAENKPTGYFNIVDGEAGVSPMYTEPFWSSDVGVRVYRDVGSLPGFLTLAAGLVVGFVSLFAAFVIRVGLKKEKLF